MDWKPQDDFYIRLSDETSLPRSEDEFRTMVEAIREVSNKYGFDLHGYGSARSMAKVFKGEEEILEKYGIERE